MKKLFCSIWVILTLAGFAIADPLENVAKTLSQGASKLKTNRVAVLTFPYYDGRASNKPVVISEPASPAKTPTATSCTSIYKSAENPNDANTARGMLFSG